MLSSTVVAVAKRIELRLRSASSAVRALVALSVCLTLAGCGHSAITTQSHSADPPRRQIAAAPAQTQSQTRTQTQTQTAPATSALRVSGNALVVGSGSGTSVQLRGINRSGTEYKCEQGGGFFDSPTPTVPDSAAMIAAMKSWDIDVVRVPLNEGCWLGTAAGIAGPYTGIAYQQAIESYVSALNSAGLFVILSLQWLDIGGHADYEAPMPDAANAPSFWKSVAGAFRASPDVLFDLYNEPFKVDWSCWRDGCEVPAGTGAGGGGASGWPAYRAAGMQQLVDAVRSTGAGQPLLLGGLDYALDLSGWAAHAPTDPDRQLVAAIHSYGGRSPCNAGCVATLLHLANTVPVVFGELGEIDCASTYVDRMMTIADRQRIGYLGWAWDAVAPGGWSCAGGPSLISSYDGTPTAYGAGFRSHLQALGPAVAAP